MLKYYRKKDANGVFRFYDNRTGKRIKESTFNKSTQQTRIIAEKSASGSIRYRGINGKYINVKAAIQANKEYRAIKREEKKYTPVEKLRRETGKRRNPLKWKVLQNDVNDFLRLNITGYVDKPDEIIKKILSEYHNKTGINMSFNNFVNMLNKQPQDLTKKELKIYIQTLDDLNFYVNCKVEFTDVNGKERYMNVKSNYIFIADLPKALNDIERRFREIYEFLNDDESVTLNTIKTYLEKAI